jgi:multisubunit Na+/H+ antiporter MnhB subunit
VFISVIVSLLFSRSNLKENLLDGLIGGFIGAGVVLLTAWIAWKELGEIKNTNSANFIHKLKGDFF